MPKLIRFAEWIRSNDLVMTALTPSSSGRSPRAPRGALPVGEPADDHVVDPFALFSSDRR